MHAPWRDLCSTTAYLYVHIQYTRPCAVYVTVQWIFLEVLMNGTCTNKMSFGSTCHSLNNTATRQRLISFPSIFYWFSFTLHLSTTQHTLEWQQVKVIHQTKSKQVTAMKGSTTTKTTQKQRREMSVDISRVWLNSDNDKISTMSTCHYWGTLVFAGCPCLYQHGCMSCQTWSQGFFFFANKWARM